MKKLILLSICFLVYVAAKAQEMNFTVKVNTPKIQTVDPKVFQDLENAVEQFLNTRTWTDQVYEPTERINANIQINITNENSPTEFSADLQVQASRPIYGSVSETVLISHNDKNFTFSYEQFLPIQFSNNSYQDNLSSVLGFYVYFILGLDGDSFAPFGGEDHFRRAQEIVNTIPTSVTGKYKGWRANDGSRNRYWMTESILNPRLRPYRQGMYDYHIRGLDLMHNDQETAKLVMAKVLEDIGKSEKSYPNSMSLQVFANSKSNEIIDIFKVSDSTTKNTVKRVMTKLDAANAAKYRAIGR